MGSYTMMRVLFLTMTLLAAVDAVCPSCTASPRKYCWACQKQYLRIQTTYDGQPPSADKGLDADGVRTPGYDARGAWSPLSADGSNDSDEENDDASKSRRRRLVFSEQ